MDETDADPAVEELKSVFDTDEMDEEETLAVLMLYVHAGNVDFAFGDEGGDTLLGGAVVWGYESCARWLIDTGADVNVRNARGETALHDVARTQKSESALCRLLLSSGAYVDAMDSSGATPLATAVAHDNSMCARMLIDAGADMDLVPALPQWLRDYARNRRRCRAATVAVLSLGKRSSPLSRLGAPAIALISAHVWSMRAEDDWIRPKRRG